MKKIIEQDEAQEATHALAEGNLRIEPDDDTPAAPQRGISTSGAILLNLVMTPLLMAGAVYTWPTIQPRFFPQLGQEAANTAQPSIDPATFTALEQKIQALEATQQQLLNAAPAQDALSEADITAIQALLALSANSDGEIGSDAATTAKIEALEQKIDTVIATANERANTATALPQEWAARQETLQAQLELLNNDVRNDFRIFATFQKLQNDALQSRPFATSLSQFEAVSMNHTALQEALRQLKTYADSGTPDSLTLTQDFHTALEAYLQRHKPSTGGFSEKLQQNLSRFVTIRRTDALGDSEESLVAQLEQHVNAKAWGNALETLRRLPAETQAHFAAWQKQVQAHQQVPVLLNDIELKLAETLLHAPSTPVSTSTSGGGEDKSGDAS